MSQSNQTTTLAGRLADLLIQGKQLSANQTIEQSWEHLLDVKKGNRVELLQRLTLIIAMPARLIKLIENHVELNPKLAMAWLDKVNYILSQLNLSQAWSVVKEHIDETTIFILQTIDDQLQRKCPTAVIHLENITELRRELIEFQTSIGAANIDPAFKAWIERQLDQIDRALIEAAFLGPDTLREATDAVIGSMYLERPIVEDGLKQTDAGKRFWGLWVKARSILSIASDAAQITSTVTGFLK